jgi:hypothetical protein
VIFHSYVKLIEGTGFTRKTLNQGMRRALAATGKRDGLQAQQSWMRTGRKLKED